MRCGGRSSGLTGIVYRGLEMQGGWMVEVRSAGPSIRNFPIAEVALHSEIFGGRGRQNVQRPCPCHV